jgi:dTMP kinase
MAQRGLLIAIEGIDGSGKHTQAQLLEHTLLSRGHKVLATGFPQYESWFGRMVGRFLDGDFGSLEAVDPHFSALLYAGDRFEAKARLESALNDGKIVLVDRYVSSNLAHQVARAAPEQRSEFLRWIEHLDSLPSRASQPGSEAGRTEIAA